MGLHTVKTMANGKLVLMNFKKLNPKMFYPNNLTKNEIKNQYCLCTPTGKLYINNSLEGCLYIAGIMEFLIQENKDTVIQYQKIMQKKFPDVKTLDDWAKMQGSENDKIQALAMFLVPLELSRRDIEKHYYNATSSN